MSDSITQMLYRLEAQVKELERRLAELEGVVTAPAKIDGRTLLGKSLKVQANG